MIQKLLVANRGEIAVRVIRAAREMGIRTVAVYSEADSQAMHTVMADEAYLLGGSAPAESYLDGSKIIEIARRVGADAIHPGYGFLSERADFSEACSKAGIIFVGPSAASMRRLGAKSDAKALATEQNVPIVPGCFKVGATDLELKVAASEIGYPVMLKASAGGGGRGMRVVRSSDDFESELSTASDEALKSFGDGAMMIEKLVERPRHVEVQVLADTHGNVACLYERECSLQRRHQKLVEEAPSPYLMRHLSMWGEMADCARRLVQASGYVGAGTVEFMVDEAEGKFYFLEVNTRLQVEHPVTESITGLDLVQWQLKIASGLPVDIDPRFIQGDRNGIKGHSIEARIVAEDPASGFIPSIGKIIAWAEPKAPGVRVDTGFGPNAEVTRFYDSLIAKVIVHAETRLAAIEKLKGALLDFHILGVKTNIGYLMDVLDHPDFRLGNIDTDFLHREFGNWGVGDAMPELGLIASRAHSQSSQAVPNQTLTGIWDEKDSFRNTI